MAGSASCGFFATSAVFYSASGGLPWRRALLPRPNEHRERVNQVVVDTLVHTFFFLFLSLSSLIIGPLPSFDSLFLEDLLRESFDCFLVFFS